MCEKTQSSSLQLSLPLTDIDEPRDEDVVFGRGGYSNNHPGNHQYLQMVEAHEIEYMRLPTRKEKTQMAMDMVRKLRAQGIRFLKKNDATDKWDDVGDLKAREKISQRLRERAPLIKQELERLAAGDGMADGFASSSSRNAHRNDSNIPNSMPSNNSQAPQNIIQRHLMQQHENQLLMQRRLQRQLLELSLENQALHAKAFHAQAMMEEQHKLQKGLQQHKLNASWQGTSTTTTMDPWTPLVQGEQQELQIQGGLFGSGHCSDPSINFQRQHCFVSGESQFRCGRQYGAILTSSTMVQRQPPMVVASAPATFPDDILPMLSTPKAEPEQRHSLFSMSSSTKSLLANIPWDDLVEEDDDDDDAENKYFEQIENSEQTVSPKPSIYKVGRDDDTVDGKRTPPRFNSRVPTMPNLFSEYAATVTPTPSSPRRPEYDVLNSAALEAWARAPAGFPLPIGDAGEGGSERQRRRNTTQTKPQVPVCNAPFRKSLSGPARAQTTPPVEQNEYDPHVLMMNRPECISKRATSHQNETEETHRGFTMSNYLNDDAGGDADRHPMSNFTSVKKASLGRDRSDQARMLKQKYMPHIYGSSTSTSSTASLRSSMFSSTASFECPPQRQISASTGDEEIAAVDLTPMELMGNKPPRLSWRNRTSTLDLNNLDDDPVLKAEQEQALAQGMEELWDSDPNESSSALDVIVQEVSQQAVWTDNARE